MSRRYPKSSSVRKRRGRPRRSEKQALAEAGCDDWLVRLPSPRPSDHPANDQATPNGFKPLVERGVNGSNTLESVPFGARLCNSCHTERFQQSLPLSTHYVVGWKPRADRQGKWIRSYR